MTPERSVREKDIFQAVVELPFEQRQAHLDKACDGDLELRAGVERLLANLGRAETEAFLEPPPTADIERVLPDFGVYQDLTYVGHGGMGVVYRAFHNRFQKHVALKVPRRDLQFSANQIFREAQNMVRLRHPNIVQVHTVNEHDGRPYFTMNFIEGPSLEMYLGDHPHDPRTVAALMVKVARAVHHAHQGGILHRDLKPGNILLDKEGEPLITDFGLATEAVLPDVSECGAVASRRTASRSFQGIKGTLSFMSPEQAEPPKEVTTLSDVYGLGAVLYVLLTGRPPFQDDDLLSLVGKVRDPKCNPELPRMLNPLVDLDLQAICLRCLDKEPARRYPSAEGLAKDLERWLGDPELEKRKERLEEETLRNNAFAAYGIASTVLWQLEEWSKPVVDIAQDPNLRELMKGGDRKRLQQYLEDPAIRALSVSGDSPFESWVLEDKGGKLLASLPRKDGIIGRSYAGRDYFQGSLRNAAEKRTGRDSVHISRVFTAEDDELLKFAISAPIRADDAPAADVLGVVAVTITTHSTMGLVQLGDERRTAVLIGRGDSAPPRPGADPGAPEGYLVLVHPVLQRAAAAIEVYSPRIGQVVWLRPAPEFELHKLEPFDLDSAKEGSKLLRSTVREPESAAGQDPFDQRRQLAGFAQVGNTELVVMVQQPYDQAVDPHIT